MPNLVNEQKQLRGLFPSMLACLDQDVRPSLRYFRRAVQLILIQKMVVYLLIYKEEAGQHPYIII